MERHGDAVPLPASEAAVRTTLVSISLAAALFAPAFSAAQGTSDVVVVTGEGVVKAAPDQAWMTLVAESRAKNSRDAQSQTAQAMTTIQQKLAGAGIGKDAVRTIAAELNIDAEWTNGRQVPRGYVARNVIEVRIDDVMKVGDVMDLAVTSGATAVQGVRFDIKQRDALEREALKRATADARARADAAAAGAGRAVDKVLRIEEPGARPIPPPQPMMMMRAAVAEQAQTPVVAGEIEIRANITLTASLK
jgi:uncharacterized protein